MINSGSDEVIIDTTLDQERSKKVIHYFRHQNEITTRPSILLHGLPADFEDTVRIIKAPETLDKIFQNGLHQICIKHRKLANQFLDECFRGVLALDLKEYRQKGLSNEITKRRKIN